MKPPIILALDNLSLFILVGGCMLVASAITGFKKSEFLPKTATGKVIACVLAIAVTAFVVWLVCALVRNA